jgi:polysaccharide export outer membrane protein
MRFFGVLTSMAAAATVMIAGCVTGQTNTPDPTAQLNALLESSNSFVPGTVSETEYKIGPLDKLSIQVFRVEDLSLDEVQVDTSGRIVMNAIGTVIAAEKTADELKAEIERRLAACCLQRPQVAVLILEGQSQRVTVLGAVTESGVYPLRGRTTLLQAVSLAKGVDQTQANLNRVAVFRSTGEGRQAAVFDLRAIQQARALDPEIQPGDIVVVDYSGRKQLLANLFNSSGLLYIFRPY